MITDAAVIHYWYDLTCPFCYLAQSRNDALAAAGLAPDEHGFQAHPEIPPEGVSVGPRVGPMYEAIAHEAAQASLPLRWQDKLPNSRLALAAVEQAKAGASPAIAYALRRALLHAHFAGGRDIGEPPVIAGLAQEAGLAPAVLDDGWCDGSAFDRLEASQRSARAAGAQGTPVWRVGDRLIVGLQPVETLLALE